MLILDLKISRLVGWSPGKLHRYSDRFCSVVCHLGAPAISRRGQPPSYTDKMQSWVPSSQTVFVRSPHHFPINLALALYLLRKLESFADWRMCISILFVFFPLKNLNTLVLEWSRGSWKLFLPISPRAEEICLDYRNGLWAQLRCVNVMIEPWIFPGEDPYVSLLHTWDNNSVTSQDFSLSERCLSTESLLFLSSYLDMIDSYEDLTNYFVFTFYMCKALQ